jgi:tRNA A37 threonylcarbamoyladenosine dehydratase
MEKITERIFHRSELLLGKEMMEKLAQKKVIIFGIGGVGSWCAESLIRSGIKNLTMVDSDVVCVTNVNRQLHATTKTVGMSKIEALKERLLDINPDTNICGIQKVYNADSNDEFELEKYDYIIDAIDSLSSKIHLIRKATRTNAVFFSSMGAALKIDPTRIKVAEFWKVRGCPLGSAIRKRIKRGDLPGKKFMCVYSDELLENKGESFHEQDESHQANNKKASMNGTVSHITAIFGLTIAGLIIQSIYNENVK